MSGWKLVYIVGVVLLSLVVSLPQLSIVFNNVVAAYQNGRFVPDVSAYGIVGLGRTQNFGNTLLNARLWHDEFVTTENIDYRNGKWTCRLVAINPETREKTDLNHEFRGLEWYAPLVVGNRLWIVGDYDSYEIMDGKILPSALLRKSDLWRSFEWNTEPAYVQSVRNEYVVVTFTQGVFKPVATVALPESDRPRLIGDVPVSFSPGRSLSFQQHDGRVHLFLEVNGQLLYRDRLECKLGIPASMRGMSTYGSVQTAADDAVSALEPANTDADLAGWSVVCSYAPPVTSISYGIRRVDVESFGMLVDGQPAALVVDQILTGSPVGHLYRFDGSTWKESASQQFPFGGCIFQTVSMRDGKRSYIVATTSTGLAHIYAAESTGFRKTKDEEGTWNAALKQLMFHAAIPAVFLATGVVMVDARSLKHPRRTDNPVRQSDTPANPSSLPLLPSVQLMNLRTP